MNLDPEPIVRDLREFCADLLAPSLAPRSLHLSSAVRPDSLFGLLRLIDSLTGLVPSLLTELAFANSDRVVERFRPCPHDAVFPRRASDWREHEGRWIPVRWSHRIPVLEPDLAPLRWLAYLLERQIGELGRAQQRVGKQIEDARISREGDSVFATSEEQILRRHVHELLRARNALEAARKLVMQRGEFRVPPCSRPPSPYPRSPAWVRLLRLADLMLYPEQALPEMAQRLLGGPAEVADLPYLYQRWCGLKFIQCMEGMGWEALGDPATALLMGASCTLAREDVSLDLWVEPRLRPGQDHPCGLRSIGRSELTPDYVLITPGPRGPDAFILDPTLALNPDVRLAKDRYLRSICFGSFATVAGLPYRRRPKRAWCAAPLNLSHCVLHQEDGSSGTVPMNPWDWTPRPIEQWAGDISDHARAWGEGVRPGGV